jgi:hypothetical protein
MSLNFDLVVFVLSLKLIILTLEFHQPWFHLGVSLSLVLKFILTSLVQLLLWLTLVIILVNALVSSQSTEAKLQFVNYQTQVILNVLSLY